MTKQKYNYEYLQLFCIENKIKLEYDYSKDKITRDTIIKGKCKSDGCIRVFEKNFRQIVESKNFGCLLCVNKFKIQRLTTTKKEQSKYNIEYLQQFCKENNIILCKDYSKENITRNTIINGKCIYNNCKDDFAKKITSLEQDKNFGCKSCSVQIKIERSENTCIKKFGETNAMYSHNIKDKHNNSMIELYNGNPMFLEEIKLKQQETVYKKYGVKNVSQNEKIKQKKIETCLINNGTEYPSQNKDIQTKMTETTFKNLGVLHNSQSDKIKQKKIETCLINNGTEYPGQSQIVKEKIKVTNTILYGFPCVLQNEDVKEKIKNTNLVKYGVEYPAQNAEISDKMSKNAYKNKLYTFPSGRTDMVQGYEPFGLDELMNIEKMNEDYIVTQRSKVPICWWIDENGKKHRYYVDIFIPSQNRCIEVKSTWTAEKKKDSIFIKQKALQCAGYICEIWIYNGKGERVECYN